MYVCWAGGDAGDRAVFGAALASLYDGSIVQVGVGGGTPDSAYWAARYALDRPLADVAGAASGGGWFLDYEPWRGVRGRSGPLTRADLDADADGLRAEILYGRCELELGTRGLHGLWWPEPGLGLGARDFVPSGYLDALTDPRAARAKAARRLRPYLEADGYDPRRLVPAYRGAGGGAAKDAELIAPVMERTRSMLAEAGVPASELVELHWVDVGSDLDVGGLWSVHEAAALVEGRAWSIDDVIGTIGAYAAVLDGRGRATKR